jgi:branched-chain amino acid transport system substrate-binding protein
MDSYRKFPFTVLRETGRILLVCGLSSLILLSACLGRRGPGDTSPAEILIGATLPETGPFVVNAGPFRSLLNAWAAMVNEAGGLYLADYGKRLPVRFIIYDDESNLDKVTALYKRLITEDQVHLLLGPNASPLSMPASIVAERYQTPMILTEANSDALYSRGFRWMVGVLDSGRKYSYAYLDLLKAKTDVQTIAFVADSSLHNKEVYEGTRDRAKELGFTVVFEQIVPAQTEDFKPVLEKVKALAPDAVHFAYFAQDAVKVLEQVNAVGLQPKALHITHHGGSFLAGAGAAAELITGEHNWLPGMSGTGTDEFQTLLARANLTVEEYPFTAIRMYALQALRAGLESAGSVDKEALRVALKTLDIQTISGRLTFAENGAGSMNSVPTQIQNGRYVLVWPEQFAAGPYQYPRNQEGSQP